MKKILVLINFFLLLIFFGTSLWKEEENLKKDSFYLKIAPRDPRSLIQGDYMVLNYEVGDEVAKNLEENIKKGYVRVKIDEKKVAHFLNLEKEYRKTLGDEMILRFFRDRFNIDFGINSYFFQEGKGTNFQRTEYAEVVSLKEGKLRLKSLRDKNFQRIK